MKTSPQTWRYLSPRTPFVVVSNLPHSLIAWCGCFLEMFRTQFTYSVIAVIPQNVQAGISGVQDGNGYGRYGLALAVSPWCAWQANGRYRNKEALR